MSTEDISSWANFLKDIFAQGNIGQAMYDNFLFYKKCRDMGNIVPWGGNEIKFPIQDQRQAGIGAVPAGSSYMPTPTVSGALRASFSARRVYGRGEIDDMVIEDSRGAGASGGGNDFAYVSALEKTRDDLLLSLKMAINAWWYGDGRGILAIMPGADNQLTITISQPILFDKGYRLDLMDASDDATKLLSGAVVSAVDHDKDSGTSTVTLTGVSAPAGTALGDYFVLENFIGAGGVQLGPFGIQAFCDSGNPALANFGELDRTTAGNEKWQGNYDSNSGTNRAWSIRLIHDNLELMRRRSAGSVNMTDLISFTNWQIMNEIFETADTDTVVTVANKEVRKLNVGYEGGAGANMDPIAHFDGVIPMHADTSAPANSQFFLNMRHIYLTEVGPPKLVDRDGSVLHMYEDRPAYQFRYLYFHEFFTKFPSAQLWVDDLAHR